MSLKTKGFSRETEALILIGGGESRTLVLHRLHNGDYMLSTLILGSSDAECTTGSYPLSFVLRGAPRRLEDVLSHTRIDDSNSKVLGPTLGYRHFKAVKP